MRLVDFNIVFLSVQKTGSTAVRFFLQANYKVDKFDNSHYSRQEILDRGLAKPTDTFVGVVREPLERQLSRYLYHAKHGTYEDASINRFRKLIIDGNGCLPYYKRAVDYDADVWLNYKHLRAGIQRIVDPFCFTNPFIVLPRVNLTADKPTNQWMVDQFYDERTRELATEYHKADTELLAQLPK